MNGPESVDLWVGLAEEDLLNIANNLASSRVPWRSVCFHAQQAAEKYLKALIAQRGVVPPPTHALMRLLDVASDAGVQLHQLDPDCLLLEPYAVARRYPGAATPVSETEAREAVAAAERIRTAVRAHLESWTGA